MRTSLMWLALFTSSRSVAFVEKRLISGLIVQSCSQRQFFALQARGFGSTPSRCNTVPTNAQGNLQQLAQDIEKRTNQRILDNAVQFPSRFMIKVIGENLPSFEHDILTVAAKTIQTSVQELNVATRQNGKYLSVTINPMFSSADLVYATYREVSKDPRVKFVL